MAFLKSKILRSIILTMLALWAVFSFWFLNSITFVSIIISILGVIALYAIWREVLILYLVSFLTFTGSYALYGFLFSFNLPLWVVMIAILLIFGYIFTYLEQKSDILGKNKLVYLFIFSLIVLEVFLFLSYFLISPINRSLIITLVVYVISGFSFWVLRKDDLKNFSAYVYLSVLVMMTILISAKWG